MTRFVLIAVLLTLLAALSGSHAAADESSDERFLDGLRSRRLFDLAELYCKERLAIPDLPEEARLDLVLELSRTFAGHAIESPADARAPFWKQARDTLDEFRRQHPQHSRLLSLGLQKALIELSAGELARQENEVGGVLGADVDVARTALRAAIQQLTQLDEQTSAELQKRGRATRNEPGQWTAGELISLQTTIRYQLARAYRNQALCYPPDSSDRLNALTQATGVLRSLAQLQPDSLLMWFSRLEELTCYRLLRDFTVADGKLAALAKEENAPPFVRPRLQAEAIHLALDQGKLERAVTLSGKPGQRSAADGPELSFARLEAFVAAWRAAAEKKDKAAVAPWEQAANDQVRYIEQTYGPYWMRRAETLLATAISASPGSESLETLVRAAASFYRGGKIDEAVAAYDRAVKEARNAQATDRAFDLAYTAATIEHQAQHFRAALDRYRDLALASPQHAKAAQAHLAAVYDAAQLAQQAAQDAQPSAAKSAADALAEYQQLLEEHLRTWPKSATAGQGAWWLGQVLEHAADWKGAVAAYAAVPPSHAQFATAIDATARCYGKWLGQLRAAGKPDEKLAADAARSFESLVVGPDGRPPDPWTPAARQAALAAARLWLDDVPDGQTQAVEVLTVALAKTDEAPAEWLVAARSLLVTALAAEGKIEKAIDSLQQLDEAPIEALFALTESLAHRAAAGSRETRKSLGRLQSKVLDLADQEREKLKPQQQHRLDRLRATALADSGDRAAALATIEKLAAELPDDGQVHEDLAVMLTEDGDTASRKEALVKWREVQTKSRPGSPRWFRASYGLARTHFLLGNKAEARAIIRLIAKAQPGLGGKEMKGQFEKLLAECER